MVADTPLIINQWDTIWRFRACFSNQVGAAYESKSTPLVLADNKGLGYQRLAMDPCGSLWFQCFVLGCSKRMGQDWFPNQAIGIEIMLYLLSDSEAPRHNKWVMTGGYFCICFVLSL
jgi:hypothetical protein